MSAFTTELQYFNTVKEQMNEKSSKCNILFSLHYKSWQVKLELYHVKKSMNILIEKYIKT